MTPPAALRGIALPRLGADLTIPLLLEDRAPPNFATHFGGPPCVVPGPSGMLVRPACAGGASREGTRQPLCWSFRWVGDAVQFHSNLSQDDPTTTLDHPRLTHEPSADLQAVACRCRLLSNYCCRFSVTVSCMVVGGSSSCYRAVRDLELVHLICGECRGRWGFGPSEVRHSFSASAARGPRGWPGRGRGPGASWSGAWCLRGPRGVACGL